MSGFSVEMLDSATEVVVIRGSGYDPAHRRRNERVVSERDPESIRAVARALFSTKAGAQSRDWMELPDLSFVFLTGREVIREVGLLGGHTWIRDVDLGDLPLSDTSEVDQWLRERGVEGESE